MVSASLAVTHWVTTHNKENKDGNINYHSYGNDGFAAGLVYENGGLLLLADYERLPDSDKSWN